MRILFFSSTPSAYKGLSGSGYNGCGWISSLQRVLMKKANVELAIAFMRDGQPSILEQDGVRYYPIPYPKKSIQDKISYMFRYSTEREMTLYLPSFKRVVEDFNPDIIQIFGSEKELGFVQKTTDKPCILHLQGILTPYYNAYCPPFVSPLSLVFRSWNPLKMIKSMRELEVWRKSAMREQAIMRTIPYFIGRTDWDKRVAMILNPRATYFHGAEILRSSFYEDTRRMPSARMTIVSTMSGALYKGLDLVLKTAQILRNELNADFVWNVYGSSASLKFCERITGIRHADVNVVMKGVGTEVDVRNALLSATAFALTAYIENSPNALCEAQILGCPVVATHVGGVASLVEDGKTGFLVPANDPYQMAWLLKELFENKLLSDDIANHSKEVARQRHDPNKIVEQLMETYNQVLAVKKSK